MSNELSTTAQQSMMPAPFRQAAGAMANINAGAVAIETERAVAEAKGQMQLAKMFPRDLNAAYAELMDACKIPALANVAFYSVPQGGQKVTGPSIRLAEEIARVYGNFEFGHRELSRVEAGPGPRDFGRSEIEVYAWDKQTNNRSIRQITVLHVLDTKEGPRKLRDQKDVDNKIANVASKQLRGRILAMMPKWMLEAAIEECKKTLSGNNDQPLSVRVRAMTQAFSKFGVTAEHLEKYLGHSLDQVLADELVDLTGVYNSIKEGTAPSEFFGASEEESAAPKASSLADTAKASTEQPAAQQQQQPAATQQRQPPAATRPARTATTRTATAATQQQPAAQPAQQEQQEQQPAAQQDNAPVTQSNPTQKYDNPANDGPPVPGAQTSDDNPDGDFF